MSTLPPLPRKDLVNTPHLLRYFEALDLKIREMQAELDDHELRIEALEP